jgi:ECF sigma factor
MKTTNYSTLTYNSQPTSLARRHQANTTFAQGGYKITFEVVSCRLAAMPSFWPLDHALNELFCIDERQGKIVEMKFFGGLSAPEISDALGISRATVDRDWAVARVWLYRQMSRTA